MDLVDYDPTAHYAGVAELVTVLGMLYRKYEDRLNE